MIIILYKKKCSCNVIFFCFTLLNKRFYGKMCTFFWYWKIFRKVYFEKVRPTPKFNWLNLESHFSTESLKHKYSFCYKRKYIIPYDDSYVKTNYIIFIFERFRIDLQDFRQSSFWVSLTFFKITSKNFPIKKCTFFRSIQDNC